MAKPPPNAYGEDILTVMTRKQKRKEFVKNCAWLVAFALVISANIVIAELNQKAGLRQGMEFSRTVVILCEGYANPGCNYARVTLDRYERGLIK